MKISLYCQESALDNLHIALVRHVGYYILVMFGIGLQELIVILVILLLLFGSKKLPELSKSIGQSVREMRKGFSDSSSDEKKKKEDKTS